MSILRILLITFILFLCFPQNEQQPVRANEGLFNMSYIFQGGPNTYVKQVDDTKNSLHVVSPNYFNVTKEGNLEISWTLRTSFISEMHKRGIKVVPFLANHWNYEAGVNGLTNRDNLAKQVAEAIETYNLDGVNVDIEGIGRTGTVNGVQRNFRDEHTDFIRRLRTYIPEQKEVSVAVAGNPNNWQTGWHGFYDYKTLSDYADYLMIMAYDESWESPESPVGPVSSLSFFENSILYAINNFVTKNKIVIGLPFYGRMWKVDDPYSDGKLITGKGISARKIAPLIDEFNGTYHYDDKRQSAYAKFTIPNGKYTMVGSTKLEAGNYLIWYENERSIKAKLRLPKKHQIKGTGSWALMHETLNTWDYYSRWLNGKYFSDVSASFWGEESIFNVNDLGWMNGTTSTTFSPNKNLTRAEGAVILIRALGYENDSASTNEFHDVNNHWAKKEIELARELEIVNGVGENKFAPDEPLTREQLAALLYNVFQFEKTSTDNPFPDVLENDWSYDAILAMHEQGYIAGFEDGSFRPKDKCTRAQMAALMDRLKSNFQNKNKTTQ